MITLPLKGNHMKSLTHAILAGAVFALTLSMSVQAQTTPAAPAAKAPIPAEFTNGEVRKVDKDAKKVTIKHEEIKNLGMPPMAMVFEVKDLSALDKFKAGDKVRFKAVYESGKYVLADIQAAR